MLSPLRSVTNHTVESSSVWPADRSPAPQVGRQVDDQTSRLPSPAQPSSLRLAHTLAAPRKQTDSLEEHPEIPSPSLVRDHLLRSGWLTCRTMPKRCHFHVVLSKFTSIRRRNDIVPTSPFSYWEWSNITTNPNKVVRITFVAARTAFLTRRQYCSAALQQE
jgi:hypothetical protein